MKLASLFITFFSITLFQLQAQTAYPFLEKNKWYFVDTNLKKIDKIIYEEIIPAENNFFYLRKKNKLALANNFGKQITEFEFDRIYYDWHFGLRFSGIKNKNYFWINTDGKIEKQEPMGCCGGAKGYLKYWSVYKKDGKYGFVNTPVGRPKSEDTLSAIYDEILNHNGPNVAIKLNGCWGIYDFIRRRYCTEPQFDLIIIDKRGSDDEYCNFYVINNGLYGWIHYYGYLQIYPKYKSLKPAANGYFFVTSASGKSGYITGKGLELFK